MPVHTHKFSRHMQGQEHIENITEEVQSGLTASQQQNGIVTIFIQHTTASVLIIEDEPGLRTDTKTLWDRMIPADPHWNHNTCNPGEDNGHSHLRGQLQGSTVTIPFTQAKLALGTWQQILVIDFDTRARTRNLIAQFMGE